MSEVEKRGELVIRRDVIAREHRLNERQAVAVEALMERGELTIEELKALVPNVHRRTLQRDLRGLVERGLAVTKGAPGLFAIICGTGTCEESRQDRDTDRDSTATPIATDAERMGAPFPAPQVNRRQ